MPLATLIILELNFISLVILGAVALRRQVPPQESRSSLIHYLFGVGILLLLIHFALYPAWSGLLVQPVFAGLILVSPLLLGVLTFVLTFILALVLRIFRGSAENPIQIILVFLAILGLLLAFFPQPYGLFAAFLPGALLLAVLWNNARPHPTFHILFSLVFLILMGISSSGLSEPMFQKLPDWVGLVLRPVLFAQAGLVVLWVSLLAFNAAEDFTHQRRKEDQSRLIHIRFYSLVRSALAIVLMVVLVFTVYWVSLWDHTDDGLGGIWLAITGSLVALAAGGLVVERRRGWLRLQGVLFLLLLPAILFSTFSIGIKIPYHPISDRRALTIQKSIQSYYVKHAHYPQSLEALVPNNLLWVPGQLILRGETWCYQGGSDYYRLGDFWRLSFSNLLVIKTYASAGSPPEAGWSCQDNLIKMKFKYDPPPLYPGGN